MTQALRLEGLGDPRRDRRGTLLLERMFDHASARIEVLAHRRAEAVGFARFLASRHFSCEEIRRSLTAHTLAACQGRAHVLVVQDTTEINLQHHARRVRGLGPVGNGRDRGLFLHGLLVLDAQDHTCLGLLDAKPWVRTRTSRNYKARPIEDKESIRWLEGQACAAAIQAACVTVIGDRESDIFEVFARRPTAHTHLLIRACRNRAVLEGGLLFDAMARLPERFGYTIVVPARPGAPARRARLVVRFGSVTLARPRRSREACASVPVYAVEVCEVDAAGRALKKGLRWRLLTTHAVADAAAALQIIALYQQRWHVEQLWRTVKGQGLDIEASQVETGPALTKLAVMAAHTATRLLQLVQARDGAEGLPAAAVFEPHELEVLEALIPALEGKTAKSQNPHAPGTLARCAWVVARLGGWKGYRHSEGPPGPLRMRRGYERFCALRDGYHLRDHGKLGRLVCKP
jgi:hypothetical protein